MKGRFVYLVFLLMNSFFLYSLNSLAQSPPPASTPTAPANASPTPSSPPTAADVLKRLDALDEKIKEQDHWSNPSILVPFLSSLLVALFGGVMAWYTLTTQRKAGMKSLLLDSLKWFEGGIQKRSIGIAIIDGSWRDFKDLRATWLSVLGAQAVYILSKSYEVEHGKPKLLPEHEFLNLEHILKLLKRGLKETNKELLSGNPVVEVEQEFTKAIEKHKTAANNKDNQNFVEAINSSQERIERIRTIIQN